MAFAEEIMDPPAPTAAWSVVDDVQAGMAAIERYPVVLEFDGLAAGKGVVIASTTRRRARRSTSSPCAPFGAGRVWSRSA